ncbi:hypothetical protein BH09PAT2_BH09PAT2_08760 [soil metagenome]
MKCQRMKKKLYIILILLALFAVFIAIRFYIFPQKAATGRIRIISSPGAGVFIDNAAVGKTPHDATLKPGDYQIKLIPEGESTNTVAWEGKVTVYENALTFISRELGTSELTSAGEVLTITKMDSKANGDTGEIYIDTDPTGGIVYLDSDQKGIAPIKLSDVAIGDHEVSVYLPGFFRRSQKVHVDKGHTLNAKFKLALDKSHKTLEDELLDKQKAASEEAKKKEEANKTSETPAPSEKTLTIKETPTGFLNVRAEPSVSGEVIDKVNPEDTFTYTDEKNGWYKIKLASGEEGWVSGDYVDTK